MPTLKENRPTSARSALIVFTHCVQFYTFFLFHHENISCGYQLKSFDKAILMSIQDMFVMGK